MTELLETQGSLIHDSLLEKGRRSKTEKKEAGQGSRGEQDLRTMQQRTRSRKEVEFPGVDKHYIRG